MIRVTAAGGSTTGAAARPSRKRYRLPRCNGEVGSVAMPALRCIGNHATQFRQVGRLDDRVR
jgi:hypothetical protein